MLWHPSLKFIDEVNLLIVEHSGDIEVLSDLARLASRPDCTNDTLRKEVVDKLNIKPNEYPQSFLVEICGNIIDCLALCDDEAPSGITVSQNVLNYFCL